MKKANRILSGLLSVSLIAALSACGGGVAEETTTTTEFETVTTTVPTVTLNTTSFLDEEQEAFLNAAEKLPDIELADKEIKWLAHYDAFHPNDAGQPKSPVLELFEQKYGGEVTFVETTWNARFDDLSTFVLGAEGLDFFPGDDEASYPKGVANGMFQPVDDYINLDDPIWDNVRSGMEVNKYGDKHYELVTSINSRFLLSYSAKTIEENGLEDPYEQWQAGEWNWDTFKASLLDFVDVENGMYGLDGWYAERGLFVTTGKTMVSVEDGQLVCNINSPEVEKVMLFGEDLFKNNLVKDKAQAKYTIQPELMGEGKELFYIGGWYDYTQDPEVWPTKIAPEDLRIVPVPCPAGQETQYTVTRADGYSLLKGASNPEGVVAFTYCQIIADADEGLKAVAKRQYNEDFQLSDEIIAVNDAINQIARDNPCIEYAAGVSDDVQRATTDGGEDIGIRSTFHGHDWATIRESTADDIITQVEDVNKKLQEVLAAD
ncbi:MAG: extracellular solute-binding protein [Ruminococcus sp.]|jgi:hypothetical protein|nr:extracellular solute-binding protein [Ruminococcus sp.]